MKKMTKKQRVHKQNYERIQARYDAKRKEWEDAVVNKTRTDGIVSPYFKPTRLKHESGFRCFEIGYCRLGKGNRVVEKFILRIGTDHIYTDFEALLNPKNSLQMNMDLTMDGYIRFFSHRDPLIWEEMPMSSASITTPRLREVRDERVKDFKKELGTK